MFEDLEYTSLEDIPAQAHTWVSYDRSITELTNTDVAVTNLRQEMQTSPAWLPPIYQDKNDAFFRRIELVAGQNRVLIAASYTQPHGDVRERLQALGDLPLANLLFQEGAVQKRDRRYVSANTWYGRIVEWQILGCSAPLLLLELFDPEFTRAYSILQRNQPQSWRITS